MTIYKSTEGKQAVLEHYESVIKQWPVACNQLRISTCEGETHLICCGDETLPPLLLLHGSMSNASAWYFDIEAWSKHFRIYAVDMIGEPGFSASARPLLGSDAYALWLDDVLSELGLSQVAIVGESLGGWLALDYATRRPDKVTKLALLAPGGVGPQRNFLFKALPLLLLGGWGKRKIRQMIFGPLDKKPSPIMLEFRKFLELITKNFQPRIEKLPLLSDQDLKKIQASVLAIVGGKDVLLDSKVTQTRLEANVANATVIYQPKARHLIRERGEILEFLTSSKSSS
ncbi:alpha/beta hydrolase [Amphritea sp.]|uniref:alpha/beta fold hydrolase n=1 Tax=Amphritea sp. TaxID=1872502 RepID=UPI0025BC6A4E|nr:alpha/beta hydrolase [Amphritea sp.]